MSYWYVVVNVFYFIFLCNVLWILSFANYLSCTLSVLDFLLHELCIVFYFLIIFLIYYDSVPLGKILDEKFGIIGMLVWLCI